jgi:hypothetical protein
MTDLKAAGADVILVVPGSWVITRRAEMPPTVGGHLSSVVGYELDRLTPLAADEAWYDYGLIEQRPDAIRLAMGAARADRIDPYLEALRERASRSAVVSGSMPWGRCAGSSADNCLSWSPRRMDTRGCWKTACSPDLLERFAEGPRPGALPGR